MWEDWNMHVCVCICKFCGVSDKCGERRKGGPQINSFDYWKNYSSFTFREQLPIILAPCVLTKSQRLYHYPWLQGPPKPVYLFLVAPHSVASQSECLLQTVPRDLAFRSWQCASHSKTMQSQCRSKWGRGWTAEEECKYAGNATCFDRLKVLFCSLSVSHYLKKTLWFWLAQSVYQN
jgi:hypothetical protein